MSKYLLIGLLIVAVAVGSYVGCDGAKARVGVAKNAALKEIDKLLGEINVKQQKVENAYDELKTASAGLHEKRIEAQVRLRALQKKKDSLSSQNEKHLSDLRKLKEMLTDAEGSGSITRGDKEISVDQLKSLADGTMKKIKMLKDQVAKNDVITSAWAKNLDLLRKNDDTSSAQLKKLRDQLDEIRSKKSALDGMKEAASITGPGESISDKFNDLTAEVDELLVNLDTKWEIEEIKIEDRTAEADAESSLTLDELLDDETDVSSTISEMDKMLQEN